MTEFPAILLFAKAPVPGTVKTRLARHLGDEEATRIHRRLVEAQVGRLPPGWPTEIHYAPASAAGAMMAWLGPHHHYEPQPSGDLGQRLRQGIGRALARGFPAVFAIGGDCPDLGPADFERGREALLSGADVVLGPTEDGGYYLIGMRRELPALFEDIPWSTPETLGATLERAREAGLRHALLAPRRDLDEPEDLVFFRRHYGPGFPGPD